jgi:thiol-disulfide isomerase/thioredoxin
MRTVKKKHISFFAASALFLSTFFMLQGATAINKEKILKTSSVWQENYTNYQVDESLLDTLKTKIGDNLEIVVYLGTWCSDSENNVPKFMKIIDALGQDVPVKYFNVKRKPNKNVKYYYKGLKVEYVPTFIFYRDGKEIGRIVENPQNSLIEDFLEIIF